MQPEHEEVASGLETSNDPEMPAGSGEFAPESHEGSKPLEGLRVLDCSADVAGQYAARLLADAGASVALIEPPEGTRTRHEGPYLRDGEARDHSTLFWHLNQGKDSVLIDPSGQSGEDVLVRIGERCDVVVSNDWRLAARLKGLGSPPRVICVITPFGADGPWANWRGSELIYQALSGTMFENGDREREPLYGVGHRASYAAGTVAYLEVLAALLLAGSAGRIIDVSIAEVAASMNNSRVAQFSYSGTLEPRGAGVTPRSVLRCADGWAVLFIADESWERTCRGLGVMELLNDARFVDGNLRAAHWDQLIAELEQRLQHRAVQGVVEEGQKAGVMIAAVRSPAQLRDCPHLEAREFWESIPGPDGREWPVLGSAVRVNGAKVTVPRPAPELGADTTRWLAGFDLLATKACNTLPSAGACDPPEVERGTVAYAAPYPTAHGFVRRTASSEWPLQGVRVLDLTTAWSGPMAARVLAALGADVIKLESPRRLDSARGPVAGGTARRLYPNGDPGERPYNRNCQFNTQNCGKRGVSLDLKDERGRKLFYRLATVADVVIANLRPGTLDGLGAGFADLSRINDQIIVVEMPAYGSGGPYAKHGALGPLMECMAGMASLVGYGDGRPVTTGRAYLDPIGAFNGAAAVLTALHARRICGRGMHIELAQREGAMHWIGEELIWSAMSGQDHLPRGNRQDWAVPHDAYPAAGEDEWIAVAAHDDAAFDALCQILGVPKLARDPRYVRLAARAVHESDLIAKLAERTRMWDKHELSERLQAAGVHAAPVCHGSDLAASAFLDTRGMLQRLTHPDAGTHIYQGLPIRIEGAALDVPAPAPVFGQHTREVLYELGGLTEAEIDELWAAGVIDDVPRT